MVRRAIYGCSFLLILALPARPAAPAGRELLVLNRGTEAIFAVQMGHAKSGSWSGDMLPFNEVVDVGEGKTVPLSVNQECLYDVRATYRDHSTSDVSNVDLCVATSISFDR